MPPGNINKKYHIYTRLLYLTLRKDASLAMYTIYLKKFGKYDSLWESFSV